MSATQHLGPGDGSIKEATTPNGAKEDTYSSIEKGTYALKRDFTASTRYLLELHVSVYNH
jgi:hypothetical protein